MKTSISVQNLKCNGCARTIFSKLSIIENISVVNIDVDQSQVSFCYKNTEDVIRVKNRLKDLGYPSIEDSNSLTSKAKSYLSCATGKLSK